MERLCQICEGFLNKRLRFFERFFKACLMCLTVIINGGVGRTMAHPAGVEPAASASGGQRSIQLSYGCSAENSIAIMCFCLLDSFSFVFIVKVNSLAADNSVIMCTF